MGFEGSMANQLLIAMPGMADPNFSTTVTLICEHNDEGALGIIINRPLELKLAGLFEQLDVDNPDPDAAEQPVLMGGPVGPERGFVLHEPVNRYENTLAVSGDIHLTLSRDVIDEVAAGDGPELEQITGFDEGPAHPQWQAELERRGIEVINNVLRQDAIAVHKAFAESQSFVYNARLGEK